MTKPNNEPRWSRAWSRARRAGLTGLAGLRQWPSLPMALACWWAGSVDATTVLSTTSGADPALAHRAATAAA